MEKEERKIKLQNLCLYFFICSFVGFILEVIYAFMIEGTFVKRGFLYGIICPIYGFGAVIMILMNNLISKKSNSIIIKFIAMSIIFTIFEYVVSAIFEVIFGIRWWDYTNEFLNLNGRICLMFSLLWGIGGVIFIKFFYDPLQNIISKIREKVTVRTIDIILSVFIIATLVDFVLSIIKYIR